MARSKQTVAWARIRLLLSELVEELGNQRAVQQLTGLEGSTISRALSRDGKDQNPQVSMIEQLLKTLRIRSSYFFEEPTPKSYRDYVKTAAPLKVSEERETYASAGAEVMFNKTLLSLIESGNEPLSQDEMRSLRKDAIGLMTEDEKESRMRLVTYLRGIRQAAPKPQSARR